MAKYILLMALLAMLTGCFKDDEAVLPHQAGGLISGSVELNPDYRMTVWFDLENYETVARHDKQLWDLAFDGAQGCHVMLNSACFMQCAETGCTDPRLVNTVEGWNFWFDKSDGNPDSLSTKGWFTVQGNDTSYSRQIYLIDRGNDVAGMHRGYFKVQFLGCSASEYQIAMADLNANEMKEITVPRHSNGAQALFNFDDPHHPIAAPVHYDLIFSQYTTLLFTDEEMPYPYLVTGVRTGNWGVGVAEVNTVPFADIDYDLAKNLIFSEHYDEIGYDWKVYDFQNGVYSIVPDKVYVIRNRNGKYIKLRFVSFYNALGVKGSPQFEYQIL